MRIILRTIILSSVLLLSAGVATAADFLVVVNESNATTTLTAREVANIFLKKRIQWNDGTKITPVVLPDANPASAAFDRQILNKSIAALRAYWQQEIFSGRNIPPVERTSDEEVVAQVQKYPGAIGYLNGGAAHAGVRVVNVTD